MVERNASCGRDLDGAPNLVRPSLLDLLNESLFMSIMPAGVMAVSELSMQRVWWPPFVLAALFPLVFGCRALAAWLDDRALIIIDDAGVRWRYWLSLIHI